MPQDRGQWSSRAGFILAAAGSAIGLGNLWKFPFITYENGGGTFVLVYFLHILSVKFRVLAMFADLQTLRISFDIFIKVSRLGLYVHQNI